MAATSVNKLGLVEIAKRTNNGAVLQVSEVLSRFDDVITDMQWVPCNQLASHVHTRRLALPTGTWRKMNYGVAPEMSQTKQIVDNVGRLESWAQIDEMTLSTLLGDKVAFRQTENAAFIMGLGQTFIKAFIDGDTLADPEKFDGLRIRTNALSAATTYPPVVLGVGGSGSDTTSVFFIQWGPDRCHMIYQPDASGPASPGAPVSTEDKGLESVIDSSGYLYSAYRSKFILTAGFAVHDARCLTRLTNIEVTPSGVNIFEPDYAVALLNGMMSRGDGSYMYAHTSVLTQMDIMAMDKVNVLYTIGDLWGEPVTYFNRKVPVRQLDAIGITEVVVA
jgi:hypothetical protein